MQFLSKSLMTALQGVQRGLVHLVGKAEMQSVSELVAIETLIEQEQGWQDGWSGAIPKMLGNTYRQSYLMARSARIIIEESMPTV